MKKPNRNSGKKREKFGKIYREYTRVKFRKYKLQFPRLRESEIVAKIIREWEAMDEEAKETLEKQFIERSGMGFLEEESSSSKRRREEAERKAALAAKKAEEEQATTGKGKKSKNKPPSPKVRVFEEKMNQKQKDDSDFKRSQQEEGNKVGTKSTPDKEASSDSQNYLGKTKAITKDNKKLKSDAKSRKEEYLTFFKYYYERLNAEHPRWNKIQITTIIKLLWRKRNKSTRRERVGSKKGLTGRQLYRKTKEAEGFLREQIKAMWKALPHESKRYWQIKGLGKPHRSKKNSGRFVRKVLNSGVVVPESEEQTKGQKDYSWMENPMIR